MTHRRKPDAGAKWGRLEDAHRVDTGPDADVQDSGYRLTYSGQYVRVGDRFAPEWLELVTPDPPEPDQVTTRGRVEVRDGLPRIVLLSFEGPDIRQSHLRGTQVDTLLAALGSVAVESRDRVITPGNVDVDESFTYMKAARGGRQITPAFLAEVARTYRENLHSGPTKAVRERFFVSARQASNYVAAARDAGLLPPTTQGKKKG